MIQDDSNTNRFFSYILLYKPKDHIQVFEDMFRNFGPCMCDTELNENFKKFSIQTYENSLKWKWIGLYEEFSFIILMKYECDFILAKLLIL